MVDGNHDPVTGTRYAKHTSHQIHNEILDALAQRARSFIINEVKESETFSLMAEQICFVLSFYYTREPADRLDAAGLTEKTIWAMWPGLQKSSVRLLLSRVESTPTFLHLMSVAVLRVLIWVFMTQLHQSHELNAFYVVAEIRCINVWLCSHHGLTQAPRDKVGLLSCIWWTCPWGTCRRKQRTQKCCQN